MKSQSQKVQEWRKRTKTNLINCLGGKCNKCGYDKCSSSLDFHHTKDKKYIISKAICNPKNLNDMIEEVRKCILLCRNCHGELHSGLWKIEDIEIIKFDPSLYIKHVRESKHVDCKCGKNFRRTKDNRYYCSRKCKIEFTKNKNHLLNSCICGNEVTTGLYCSQKCATFDKRKVERPSKEQLELLVWSEPTVKIAKLFGVSDKAIDKWCKTYNIAKPPRGYWQKQKRLRIESVF